jgi:hypothetical protein
VRERAVGIIVVVVEKKIDNFVFCWDNSFVFELID